MVRALLTLAALAHPNWGLAPTEFDVAEAMATAVGGLDRPRAALAAGRLYDAAGLQLRPVGALTVTEVDRIGPLAVKEIGRLLAWLVEWPGAEPLDRFFGTLFDDLLCDHLYVSRPDEQSTRRRAAVCDWLIRTAGRFRRASLVLGLSDLRQQGITLTQSIQEGLVTGNPLPADSKPDTGVVVATLYAYLLSGPSVRVQVWLDAGATGWWDIPRQPLSNAFVLTPEWKPGRPWTEAEGVSTRDQLLARLVRGLCNRCQEGVVLASSDLDRRGQTQQGQLWRALQPLL